MRPYLEKIPSERAGGVAQTVGPEFKPQYHRRKAKGRVAQVVEHLHSK
jgi:hypothetical protein